MSCLDLTSFWMSLRTDSPLDVSVKGQLIHDVLNLAGFVLPKKEDIISSGSSGHQNPQKVWTPISPQEHQPNTTAALTEEKLWSEASFSTLVRRQRSSSRTSR
ncbi:hypothetical protein KOW79_013755 [Hemibagrus wyckioides]|uniref:Uncharacterized protein n=1 Tax=Hemibagrus wyckioides TaxID=337641 RepID=A0A9D3NIJ4_9TELE|nr:hypothetical protein KOW79_013755 [Hemibagrus wyckioides]